MRKPISIQYKVALPSLLMLFILVTLFGFMINRYGKILGKFQSIELLALKQAAVGNLRFMTHKTIMSVNDYIITENEKYKNDYRENLILLKKYLHQFSEFSLSDEEKMLSANINENLDSVIYYAEDILMITKPKSSSRAAMLMEIMDYKFAEEVFENAVSLFDYTHNQILSEKQKFIEIRKSIYTYVILIFSVSLLIVALYFYLSKKNISNPILALSKAAESIAEGDYSQRPLIKTNDEIELLSKVFSKMAVSIQESQQKLLESKYFNESIIETIPSGLIVVKKSTGIDLNIYDACEVVIVNRSFCEMFDIPLANAIGKPVAELLHEINLSEVCRNVVSDGKTVWNVQCECHTPTKGKMILNLSLTGLELGEENILIVIDDVTELKKAEESLRLEKEKAQKYLDVARVMMVVIDTDQKVSLINKKGCEILGCDENEIIGKNWFDNFIPLRKRDEVKAVFNDIVQGRLEMHAYHENEIITKSGEERLIAWHNTVIKDENGKIISTLSSGEDITERRIAEQALRDSQEQLKLITETTGDVLYRLRYDSMKYDYINPAIEKLTEYTAEEINEIGFSKIVERIELLKETTQSQERLKQTIKSARTSKSTDEYAADYVIRTKSGKLKWVSDHSFPWKDSTGNLIGSVGILSDITERKNIDEALRKSEKQLRELNAAKDKLFSIISHDLKSPFNSILGFSEILQETYKDLTDEERLEIINSISSTSKRTFELVENLLNWSYLERGKLTSQPEKIILKDLSSKIISLLSGNAFAKKINITNDIAEDTAIFADRSMISSVIQNLISNAIKFTHRNGEIKIKAEGSQNMVTVSVIDNGVGIPKKDFDKLFRIDSSYSNKGTEGEPGTGLGLMLCKEYVEKNSGKMWVESEVGKGSVFSFTLPMSS